MTGLTVRELGASYGRRRVLWSVDIELAAGEMLAILGPSGCGKTTLLRSLAGLHRIDRGSIDLNGRLLAQASTVHVAPERRGIGLMPQEGGLFPHLSVGHNIAFGLTKALWSKRFGDRKRRLDRVHELLELVGLQDAIDSRPSELSGGQQQRVALARALAPEPAAVLMDEPFASLDTALRAGIRQEVRMLLKASGTPALLVTHDRAEAMTTADRVAVMLEGRTVQTGTPEEVYRRPNSPQVGTFVGESILVDAFRTGSQAECVFGVVGAIGAASGRGQILVRPEQLRPIVDPAGRFQVSGTLFAGPHSLVTLAHVDTGYRVTAWVGGTEPVLDGARVRLDVDGPVPFFAAAGSTVCDAIPVSATS